MTINPAWLVKEPPTDDDDNEIALPEGATGWAINADAGNTVAPYYPHHELFPLEPLGAWPRLEFRDIVRIKVHRYALTGGEHTRETSAKKYGREELPDFEAVVERFGGGVYQYQGFARSGQISAWSPGGKDRDRSAAPMLALDGSGEAYTPPAAPASLAPAPAQREPSPFEMFMMQQATQQGKTGELIAAGFTAAVSIATAFIQRPAPVVAAARDPLELAIAIAGLTKGKGGDGEGGGDIFSKMEKFAKMKDLFGGGEDSLENTMAKSLAPVLAARLLPPEKDAGGDDLEARLRAMERRMAQPREAWTVGAESSPPKPPPAAPRADFDALLEELDRDPAKKAAMGEALARRERARATPPKPPAAPLPTIGQIAADPKAQAHVWACIERRDMSDPVVNVVLEAYANTQGNPSGALSELRGEHGERVQTEHIGHALGVLAGLGFRPPKPPKPPAEAAPPKPPAAPKPPPTDTGFSLTEDQILKALEDPEIVAGLDPTELAELTELARPVRERLEAARRLS